MPDEIQDVNAESSTAPDVNAESSTAAPVETTTPKVEQEKVVPYDRFKEVADEKNYWREQAIAANQRQQPAQQTQEPLDPYLGMDAQTKVFWQEIDRRTEIKIKAAKEEARRDYQLTIDALSLQTAKIQEKLFRNDAKDVVAGSPEEVEIANLVRAGLDLERATWAVMGPKREAAAKSVAQVKQQVKTQQKSQANLENASMPTNNGIPTKERLSFREQLASKMQQSGI